MRIALVFGLVGQQLRLFSVAFIFPLLLALFDQDWASVVHFSVAFAASLFVGTLTSFRLPNDLVFVRSEALAVVALTWLAIGVFAAIPYVFAGLSPVDALFESISGITATGATVLTDFSLYTRAFFLWRAMTQWFGGLGVIALFVVVLPRLGIAGRQMFFAEAFGAPGQAISPQARRGARKLWLLYSLLTVLLAVLLWLCGMTPYEAIAHAFTTMSAGGFSPNNQSIAGYANPLVEWVLVLFMLLAGASFTLQWKVFTGRPLGFFRDGEFLSYSGVALAATLITGAMLAGALPSAEHLRVAAFQVVSLMTSTGYASTDYNLWEDSLRVLLVVVMVVGGCAGSAAGGPKVVRLLLVVKYIGREITQVLHPRAVRPLRYGGRPVPAEIMRAVFTLVFLYLFGYFAIGALIVASGVELTTGFSAALSCLGNIGPAFGMAGPMGNFAGFSVGNKLLLTAAMWVGRLEIVTVLALLHPHVWRSTHVGWPVRQRRAAPVPSIRGAETRTNPELRRGPGP